MECFEGNAERVDSGPGKEESKEAENDHVISINGTMSENPVSFVVGGPDTDLAEELEVEDSFPSEGSDMGLNQAQQNILPGLVERRKRLR